MIPLLKRFASIGIFKKIFKTIVFSRNLSKLVKIVPIIEKTILFVPTRHDFQNYLKLSPFTLRKVKLSGLMDTQKSLRSMLLGQHENHGKQKFRWENKCEEQRSDANVTSFFTYLKG